MSYNGVTFCTNKMKVVFNIHLILFLILISEITVNTRSISPKVLQNEATVVFDEKNKDHWRKQAQWTLREKVSASMNTNGAKNIIYFIGDGMSLATLAATRVYLGHKYGHTGEEIKLFFEAFPYTGLAKTYCVDQNVADSACSGTAYLSGVKANSGTVGVTAAVKRGVCDTLSQEKHLVTGLMDWAQRAGKATGLVTTTRVTHATPSASYAHSAERKWESDAEMPKYASKCEDIALQLVNGRVGSNIDVVLGGGRKKFFPRNYVDEEGYKGYRKDGRNLIEEWLTMKTARGSTAAYVYNRTELLDIDPAKYESVLGLFSPEHMPYNLERTDEHPALREMTKKAIQILSNNKNGFFLFVEGGKIDMAHHETKARKALDETAEFSKAIETAANLVSTDDTLIVVTADHSHTMTYNGYSKRGSDVLGFSNKMNGTDNMPYTTLSYANGPGFKIYDDNGKRRMITTDDLQSLNFTYPSLFPLPRESHGGEDVAVFANGPWAHIFTGNYEQNYLPHAIAFAACIGPGLTLCDL